MQQLCLTGASAAIIADRLFSALNVRPMGLRILPFTVDGCERGDALHLLPPPAPPALNGVPCRIRLTPQRSAVLTQALEEIAAPGLTAALRIQSPLLLEGLSGDLLACDALRDAVKACLMSRFPVVITADAGARKILQTLTPREDQLWFDVPEDPAGQSALLEQLIPEAALRF